MVIALGLGLAVNYSLGPQSVPKIKFVQFPTAEKFGEEVLEKTKDEIRESNLVFLGVTPGQVEDLELWKGFLAANQEPGSRYDVVIIEPNLPYADVISARMSISLRDDRARLIEGVQKALDQKMRVAVIVPSVFSTQLLPGNPIDELKKENKLKFLSFSVVKYPLTPQQESEFEPRCAVDKEDRIGTGALGCLIRSKARLLYRKKFESAYFSGLMDQTGESDYLILFNRNGATKF